MRFTSKEEALEYCRANDVPLGRITAEQDAALSEVDRSARSAATRAWSFDDLPAPAADWVTQATNRAERVRRAMDSA